MRTSSPLLVLLPALLLSACGDQRPDLIKLGTDELRTQPLPRVDDLQDKALAKSEWTPEDAPSLFDSNLEYRLAALPETGEADTIPWAGAYWPTSQDSVNNRWAGANTESPAAKYGEAFDVASVEDLVSEHYGIDRYKWRSACTSNSDCDTDEGACSIRAGEESGYCIPTWWGICHAWAPAAILQPEPLHPVTRNGVTFEINDIKALVTLAYDETYARGVSLRCNQDSSVDTFEYDAYGRPADSECVDTNPGTFHVVLTNYLGLRGESFVEDRTWDDEVWNQPMRGYRVTLMDEVTAQQANQLLGVDAGGQSVQSFGASLAAGEWHHEQSMTVVTGQSVVVEMHGDGDADLYVRFGASPSMEEYECRPYDAHSNERCELIVPEGETRLFVSARGYSGLSTFEVSITLGGEDALDEYAFNALAEHLYRVRTEVEYIFEPSVSVDGNLSQRIDDFTGTDVYEYILEVNHSGEVIGGEWQGASRRNHPDFLWLPISRNPYGRIANGAIEWTRIEELLDASVAGEDISAEGGSPSSHQESGELARGEWAHFGPYEAGSGTFSALLTGTGDADLYVRRDAAPTTSTFDCRPYRSNSEEGCDMAAPGTFWIGVRGYRASSFDLDVSYISGGAGSGGEASGNGAGNEQPETIHLQESGYVTHGEMETFSLTVSAGQRVVVRTTAPNDVDLYLRMAAEPTQASYDLRAFTLSGDETLDFTASSAGTLHVGVHGWAASSFTLWSADQ